MCLTIDRLNQLTFKDKLLDLCSERDDAWSREVEIRINGAAADLPAVEARYHGDCYSKFKKMPSQPIFIPVNPSLNVVIEHMNNHAPETCTSSELYDIYKKNKGELKINQMMTSICDHFGDRVLVLLIEGCS